MRELKIKIDLSIIESIIHLKYYILDTLVLLLEIKSG